MSKQKLFSMYERAVQTPDVHAQFFDYLAKNHLKHKAITLREDFCGTARISLAWIRRNLRHHAIGVDLDPEPIEYSQEKHFKKLKRSEKSRMNYVLGDVRSSLKKRSDLTVVCNFSFFIFHHYEELGEYFHTAFQGINDEGLIILEVPGGPGMSEEVREKRSFFKKNGEKSFDYFWVQKEFNPIHQIGHYAIDFKVPGQKTIKDAFTYHWRLWSIPEIRTLLESVGFSQTFVYWEEEEGKHVATEEAPNEHSWISYIVGVKSKPKSKRTL